MLNVRLAVVRELGFPFAAILHQKLFRADVPRRGIDRTLPCSGVLPNLFLQPLHCAEAQLEYPKFVRSVRPKTHASERDPLSALRFNPYCLTRIPA